MHCMRNTWLQALPSCIRSPVGAKTFTRDGGVGSEHPPELERHCSSGVPQHRGGPLRDSALVNGASACKVDLETGRWTENAAMEDTERAEAYEVSSLGLEPASPRSGRYGHYGHPSSPHAGRYVRVFAHEAMYVLHWVNTNPAPVRKYQGRGAGEGLLLGGSRLLVDPRDTLGARVIRG
jgi:hypothetical protein